MREIRTSGSVRSGAGNVPTYSAYLVVGAGATAMSFVDTLLSETDADVTMVDRRYRPGGHWNDAYPSVRLHQPSASYRVCSRELSNWTKDKTGLNQGLYGLASGAEVLAHFEQVLQDRFLPSGRPMSTKFSARARWALGNPGRARGRQGCATSSESLGDLQRVQSPAHQDELRASHQQDVTRAQAQETDRLYDELISSSDQILRRRPARAP